jgi:hypothetical protein
MGMHSDWKAEITWWIATYFILVIAAIVAAHYLPVFLHKQNIWICWMHGKCVDTVTHLGGRIGDIVRH